MTIGDEPRNADKVQQLQAALHAKAKESPAFRFYALYDKVYRWDVLRAAYRQCRRNDGAPGVDQQTFAEIEEYGVERWLGELAEELGTKTYRPQAVRRVYIPKPDGKQRPLGIPTIRDRVVQTALMLILEPIFEADLQPEQYAYRADRSALDAVSAVHRWVCYGHTQVVDADLSGYFDTIPHAELMQSLARRISDKAVLHLVKMWLEAPVEETDERGHVQRTTRNKDTRRGTPQGSPISPLLANLYMRRFILGWKTLGHEHALRAKIVNYADDFVILCRGTADEAMPVMRSMMDRLKLTVNEQKTRLCRLPNETFDFLGYTIGPFWSRNKRRMVLGTRPSRKSVAKVKAKISELTGRHQVLLDEAEVVKRINTVLQGWGNYFSRGPVSSAYRDIDLHTRQLFRKWLVNKHQKAGRGISRYPDSYLFDELGLIRLTNLRTSYLRGRTA
ncbi:MAG TPA: group II intron reverse transcriptase/maturase [Thermoguttaceae bacterium]|jgi:group II intron reverse transcriptase/maturase|nr:group II intron reverse transcriptase/maturase [Thermoguttaceae bacterium]